MNTGVVGLSAAGARVVRGYSMRSATDYAQPLTRDLSSFCFPLYDAQYERCYTIVVSVKYKEIHGFAGNFACQCIGQNFTHFSHRSK